MLLRENSISQEYTAQLQKLKVLASEASTLYPLAVNDNLQIVNASTDKARQFDEKIVQNHQKQKAVNVSRE